MKNTIVFIEDNSEILAEIRHIFHNMESVWNLHYFDHTVEASSFLHQHHADILCISYDLTSSNSENFIGSIQSEYPNTARIIYYNESSDVPEKDLRKYAHEIIKRPFGSREFLFVIQKTLNLHKILSDDNLIQTLSKITELPTMPDIYLKLKNELEKEDCYIRNIAEIISEDVAMTAELLKFVNSAYFSLPTKIMDPTRAISYIGIEALKAIVIQEKLFSYYGDIPNMPFSFSDFNTHSQLTGHLAKQLTSYERKMPKMIEESFTAGMLHDIGKLVLLKFPDFNKQKLEYIKEHKCSGVEAEYKILGTSHAEIGAYLLGLWNFPDSILEAVAFHHYPEKTPLSSFSTLTSVYIANGMTSNAKNINDYDTSTVDTDYVGLLKMSSHQRIWKDMMEKLLPHKKDLEKF